MKKFIILCAAIATQFSLSLANADGNETLGPPSIAIAPGTGIVAEGTGMTSQSGTIDLTVPVGATVEQVLLYWQGFATSGQSDNTITIEGNFVTGTLIGGPDFFFGPYESSTYRVDITNLGLVTPGTNSLSLADMSFDFSSNGAGIMAIIDDGSGASELIIRDGDDVAWVDWTGDRGTTALQTFNFAAAGSDRTATLSMFFGGVEGKISTGGDLRPTTIEVNVGGTGGTTLEFNDELGSFDGEEWDTFVIDVLIPADVSSLSVQAFSDDRNGSGQNPASFVWTTAGLSIPLPAPPLTASLGDRVWNDLNRDGIQDDNEPGIEGVDVRLTDCNGTQIGNTLTTGAGGLYLFENLDAGTAYCVEFDEQSAEGPEALNCDASFSAQDQGTDDSLDSDANISTGLTSLIILGAGEDNLTIDAGLYCPAKLGDFVWEDTDRDGIQDGDELGLEDVTVTLLKCDADGNTTPMGTETTDANGMYMFSPLPPGDYAVQFTAPNGYVFSPADAGNDDAVDSDANTATGQTMCMPLESNQNDPTRDAGLYPAPLSGLGDTVWHDLNANGLQDSGEPGVFGANVTLLLPGIDNQCNTVDDEAIATTTTTDENGEYMFEGLFPGRHCVAFDISASDLGSCSFGDGPVFTAANQGNNDAADSDADPATGKTGNIDLGLLEYDPTNDAGIYCPGKLGDRVWEDDNDNGLQDDGELGVDNVGVNLYKCVAGAIVGDPITTTSTSGGIYMFSNLMPGSYAVQFVEPADLDFARQNEGSDDTIDSDADGSGFTACTDIESNEYDDTLDAGLIDPPDCGIGLVKTCEVITPPAPPLESCQGKIQSFTMIWTGGTTSIAGIDNDSVGTVVNRQEVTFSAPSDGWDSNDNFLTVGDGKSVFHVSCSDEAMDGETDDPAFPADCGRLNGDGKDDDLDFINLWQFEGLTDADGQVVDCTVEPPVPTSSCEFSATFASCDTLPEKPTMFSFVYSGGGCDASDNTQGDKFECIDSVNADSTEPPTVTLSTSAGETIANVEPGDLVTIEKDGSETEIYLDDGAGGIETIVFHTSCSAPLITSEIYGSLTLAALDGQGSGKEVLYSYLVTNGGSDVITNISVTDSVFGPVGSVEALNPDFSETLTAMSFISDTTTNVATATGSGTGACIATAEATVTVLPPPPCTVTVSFKELKDDLIKYTVTNTGNRAASLDELTFDFPSDFVAIKEVKLDGGIYKSGDSSLVIEPGDTIGSGDWTEDDASKRVLDPGEDRTLEIKFEEKAKGFDPITDFNGTVKFNDGDCMILL